MIRSFCEWMAVALFWSSGKIFLSPHIRLLKLRRDQLTPKKLTSVFLGYPSTHHVCTFTGFLGINLTSKVGQVLIAPFQLSTVHISGLLLICPVTGLLRYLNPLPKTKSHLLELWLIF